jgi:CBS domain containing-hemolysin-like protein
VIEESERAMIHSIFELGDTIVREIMVPRPDMVMVSADDSLREVLDVMLRAGHSRIPVYRDDRDRIVGLVYAKDVLRRLHTGGDEEGPWGDMLREPHFVPELKTVDDLLREMQTRKFHLAIVVDEYGATAGLVTIEDILEEIVGEIVDEYDREEALVEEIDADLWRVDARLPVDELNELLSSALPDEEWDTVGGLLFGMLGHVPAPGERVEADTVRLTAERVKGRRIAKVIVERIPEGPVEATHAG